MEETGIKREKALRKKKKFRLSLPKGVGISITRRKKPEGDVVISYGNRKLSYDIMKQTIKYSRIKKRKKK